MKHLKLLGFTIFLLTIQFEISAQSFQFEPMDSISVYGFNQQQLDMPWNGGFWISQLGELDLNKDGLKDLLIYDRVDHSGITLIKEQLGPNLYTYRYAAKYETLFPRMIDWMRMADYNFDGLQDLYFSANGGAKLYEQSLKNGLPNFTKISDLILADYGFGIVSNLYVDNGDIPVIDDMDGDGDMDILSFDNLYVGQINFFESQSMDKYGVPDSLEYLATTRCWGRFTENSFGSNVILALDENCKIKTPFEGGKTEDILHLGSTILSFDFNKDSKKDLLMGDVSFNNFTLLINESSGSLDSIVATDTLFPSYDKPVDLNIFPAPYAIDYNEDGRNDIVAIPNAPMAGRRSKQIWLYENYGNGPVDSFRLVNDNFLLSQSIDHGFFCAPMSFDCDNDGDEDLILSVMNDSSWTRFHLYENRPIGGLSSYHLVDTDYLQASLNNLSFAIPSKGDIDGDNDEDIIVGLENGTLIVFQNTGFFAGRYIFSISAVNYQGIDVGFNAAPEIFDVNSDGLLDLIIGEYKGRLNYYENSGTKTNADFSTLTSADFGKIRINEYFTGYSMPRLVDVDKNGSTDLVLGTERGRVYFYHDPSLLPTDSFISSTNNFRDTLFHRNYDKQFGFLVSPWMANVDRDTFPDLILGTYKGGAHLFSNAQLRLTNSTSNEEAQNINLKIYPNPGSGTFNLELDQKFQAQGPILSLYNSIGQIVDVRRLESGRKFYQYFNSELSAGFYIIRLESSSGERASGKVIVTSSK